MLTENCGGFYVSPKSQAFWLEETTDATEDAPPLCSSRDDKKLYRVFSLLSKRILLVTVAKTESKLKSVCVLVRRCDKCNKDMEKSEISFICLATNKPKREQDGCFKS